MGFKFLRTSILVLAVFVAFMTLLQGAQHDHTDDDKPFFQKMYGTALRTADKEWKTMKVTL